MTGRSSEMIYVVKFFKFDPEINFATNHSYTNVGIYLKVRLWKHEVVSGQGTTAPYLAKWSVHKSFINYRHKPK